MMPLGVLAVTSGMNLPTISAIPRAILGGDGNHYRTALSFNGEQKGRGGLNDTRVGSGF